MKPVEILRNARSPVIVSVPHGSDRLPDDVRKQMRTGRRNGPHDVGTREIVLECAAPHATVVLAGFSRIVVDVNRYPEPAAEDLAPSNGPEADRKTDSERLIRRYDGRRRLWKEPLSEQEIHRRIHRYHEPFHRSLAGEISRLRRAGKPVLLSDLHSMADDSFDFILGDNGGRSAGRTVCLLVRRLLSESLGIDIGRVGYAGGEVWDAGRRGAVSPSLLAHTGGFITVNHGNPRKKIFAVQLEVSRFLYTSPNTGRIRRRRFDEISAGLARFFKELAETWKEHGSAV